MKFFIYLCCIAYLLTKISARLRLTTPMTSALRSNDDAARQASNIAKMIDFINTVYNDGGRSIARSDRYDSMLRRFELPAVQSINIPPSVVVPNDQDTANQLEKLEDTVRYHVIDNPEVLEEFSNKQKLKNNEKLLNPVTLKHVVSETNAEAKTFSTVENKLEYYRSRSKFTGTHPTPNPNPLDGLQELTPAGRTYRPSFPDDDDDDDKIVTEDIEVSGTENEIKTPRVEAKNHSSNTEKQSEINNTVEIEKKTQDNKALDKEKARIKGEKTQIDDTKELGQIKQELRLKAEKNNDPVTVVEEKSGSYKEYMITKLDHNNNDKLSEGSVRPRDEGYKNDGNKQIYSTTDTNNEEYKKANERSWDTNIVINVPVDKLIGRKDKSALRTKKNNNHDHKEQHSIYAHKERNENRNKQFKHRHEKRHERDRKRDKYNDGWSQKEKDWKKIDKQRYDKDIGYDRMEHEWNKRHQQYDENENLDMNNNQWDKNDDFNSRDYDSDKSDDDDSDHRYNYWQTRNNDWDKTDDSWEKRDNGWNDRDKDLKKRDNYLNKRDDDWNKRDIDSNKRNSDRNKKEIDSNKRENIWNKRESQWIKQEIKSYKDDRDKNDWHQKQNERDNKYSEINIEKDRGLHDRYEIVDREIIDGDFNQHSEV